MYEIYMISYEIVLIIKTNKMLKIVYKLLWLMLFMVMQIDFKIDCKYIFVTFV